MIKKDIFGPIAQNKSYRQFVKFSIVGAVNTLVDWIFFYLFKSLFMGGFGLANLQMARQLAKAASFVVSASSGYVMNRKWTFRSADKNVAKEALKFMIVALGGLVINQAVFYVVTSKLAWRDIFGLAIATASAMFWNFIMNKKWTFKAQI